MRKLLLLLLLLPLVGCSQFEDEYQELDYLERQAVTTPAQYKRMRALQAQFKREMEGELARQRAAAEDAQRAKAEHDALYDVETVYRRLVYEDEQRPAAQRKQTYELRQAAEELVKRRLAGK